MTPLLSRPRGVACGACLGPWGTRVEDLLAWCAADAGERPEPWRPPVVPGFIESQFNPLARAALEQCLAGHDAERLAATGVVLGSVGGDATTADVASRNLVQGRVRNPLLFYQSIPNSIMGFVSRNLGLTGPLSCVAGTDRLHADLLEMADLWLERPEVRQVVVLAVELTATPRTEAAAGALAAAPPEHDVAVALLLTADVDEAPAVLTDLRRVAARTAAPARPVAVGTWPAMRGLLALCTALHRLEAPTTLVIPAGAGEALAAHLAPPPSRGRWVGRDPEGG